MPTMFTSSRQVEIKNTLGLHLRAADKFVGLARQFRADVCVARDGRIANGKSILDLTMLAAECGSRLQIETQGVDAHAALDALTGLVDRGFDQLQPGMDALTPPYTALDRTPDRRWSNSSGDTPAAGLDGVVGSFPDS